MREVSVPFEAITDLNCGCFLRSSVTIRFCNQEIHLPAFFLPRHMHTVTPFIFVGLFVCVSGSLVSW